MFYFTSICVLVLYGGTKTQTDAKKQTEAK